MIDLVISEKSRKTVFLDLSPKTLESKFYDQFSNKLPLALHFESRSKSSDLEPGATLEVEVSNGVFELSVSDHG